MYSHLTEGNLCFLEVSLWQCSLLNVEMQMQDGTDYFHETSGVIKLKSKGQTAKGQDADATFAVVLYLALHQKQMEARRPADLSCLAAHKKQIKARQPKDL